MDRAARTNSAERRKGRLVIHAGGQAYGRTVYGRNAAALQPHQRRGYVPAWLIWGVGGPMHRAPNPDEKGPHRSAPKFTHRKFRSGPAAKVLFIIQKKKFVCNTKERAEFFGPVHGVRRLAPRRAAHAWKASDREQNARPGTVCGRDIVERMGAGAPVASGRARLGRKNRV